MSKRLIIYDAAEESWISENENDVIISANPIVRSCAGCFSCWVKTPAKCAINDRCSDLVHNMAKSDELIIVTPCVYGGYSAATKAMLDRSIGYILPYFRIVKNEMHHKIRYKRDFKLSVYFYGEYSRTDKETAEMLVKANGINYGSSKSYVYFYNSYDEIREVLK